MAHGDGVELSDEECRRCGEWIPVKRYRRHAQYCSPLCQRLASLGRAEKARNAAGIWNANLASGSVGAVHELLVCADLLKRGYDVFRSMSPAANCDVVILDGDQATRVEVTTGYRTPSGKLSHPKKKGDPRHDVVAVVTHDGEIAYSPRLSSKVAKSRKA